jgi:RNA polymerase sigma factor (sigma-70 family)
MANDDMALVREYADSNSEQAFAKLVSRNINLVYSVARRQVRDPHLAEEITQSVFIILARKAGSLSSKTILSGWLCRTARYISANTVKTQRHRQIREHESHMQSIVDEPDPSVWGQLAPMLDDALNCLGAKEHDAVVLRFVDGKEFKEVGAALGSTEDAARMRINRAIEKLRKFFAKRGVTVSAAAIAGAIGANSIQAAPAGLGVTITAAALSGTSVTTAAFIAATKAIAMTTFQKTIVGTTVAVLAAAAIYKAREASRLRALELALQSQQWASPQQVRVFQAKQVESLRQLEALRADNARLNRNTEELLRLRGKVSQMQSAAAQSNQNQFESLASTWASRANQVKEYLEQTPEEAIPELQLLSSADWLREIQPVYWWKGETNDFKFVLGVLRTHAKARLARGIGRALGNYLIANQGQLPGTVMELKPYLNLQYTDNVPVTDEMLQRYELIYSGNVNVLPPTEPLILESGITQKAQYDALFKIGAFALSSKKIDPLGADSQEDGIATRPEELKKLFAGQ